MVGCHHCIMCDDMENESYCIKNKKYEKEEYMKKAKDILDQKKMYPDFYDKVNREGKNYGSTNVTGSFLLKSHDVENGYYSLELKDAKNLLVVG